MSIYLFVCHLSSLLICDFTPSVPVSYIFLCYWSYCLYFLVYALVQWYFVMWYSIGYRGLHGGYLYL